MFGSISELFWLSELHRSFLACRSESLVKHKRACCFELHCVFNVYQVWYLHNTALIQFHEVNTTAILGILNLSIYVGLVSSIKVKCTQEHFKLILKKASLTCHRKRHVSGHLYLSFYLNLQQKLRQIKCIHSHLLWNSSW